MLEYLSHRKEWCRYVEDYPGDRDRGYILVTKGGRIREKRCKLIEYGYGCVALRRVRREAPRSSYYVTYALYSDGTEGLCTPKPSRSYNQLSIYSLIELYLSVGTELTEPYLKVR